MGIIRVPFATPVTERSAAAVDTDVRYVNCYPEVIANPQTSQQKRYYVKRRPGVGTYTNYTLASLTAPIRGFEIMAGDTYVADKVGVWKVSANKYVIRFNTQDVTPVGMIVASVENNILFVCDGRDGWLYTKDSDTSQQINPKQWTASTSYSYGDNVRPSTYNGYNYTCTVAGTSGGTEPTWPTTVGSTVVDGGVTWKCIDYIAFPSTYNPVGTWSGSYNAPLGYTVTAGTTGLYATCTVAGTTGGTVPTWPKVVGATINDGGVTWSMITPSSLVTGHVPKPVTLNGYIFLLNNIGEIVNCNPGDFMVWPALDFISSSIFPLKGMWIENQANHLAVYTASTIEYLYVNDSSPQGSPLSRTPQAATLTGIASIYSAAQKDGAIFFVAESSTGGVHVAVTDGLQTTPISHEVINRIISTEGAAISTAIGNTMRVDGHYFYLLKLQSQQRTLVYDINERYWSEWTFDGGYWPFVKLVEDTQENILMFDATTVTVWWLDNRFSTDNNLPIQVLLQTPNLDGGNFERKYCTRVTIIGDIPRNVNPVYININYSDDDYQTWNVNTKQLQLNAYRPTKTQWGSFRRRAFKLTYTDPSPFRLESLEIELLGGENNGQ
jgi:hypothetical protein